MKRFISTKFFSALQESSQKGVNAQVLQNRYDEFVMFLLSEGAVSADREAYHSSLAYTRVELTSLTEVSKKKCSNLFAQSHQTC